MGHAAVMLLPSLMVPPLLVKPHPGAKNPFVAAAIFLCFSFVLHLRKAGEINHVHISFCAGRKVGFLPSFSNYVHNHHKY